ncbi:MAG: hypothetical protein EXR05_08850 [Acetobacteraceae bacterium]|nr:hypothetical protein [Acetobacteraceae bacterium]MSP29017.1 hypothetical protein [Acetobacteraceae bacterium]
METGTDRLRIDRAVDHPLAQVNERLKLREAKTGFGIALRYQERACDAPDAPAPNWCETRHSIFILAGRTHGRFDDHVVEAGPGDMLHIPPTSHTATSRVLWGAKWYATS